MDTILKLLKEEEALWAHLKTTKKPIYIYGMGDGALKIISVLERIGVPIAGIYASNDFVRGHSFYGHQVLTLSAVKAKTPDFISLLAFATFREPMLDTLYALQNECEFYAPDVPVCPEDDVEIFDLDYIRAHEDELLEAYEMLADDWSRQVFLDTLNFKVSGKIDYLKMITSPISEVYMGIIKPTPTDCYADLGAYNGDTIAETLCFSGGELARIIAFEPDKKNFRRLGQRIKNESIQNVEMHNLGAWSHNETLHFSGKGGRNAKLSDNGSIEVQADSLDNILNGRDVSIIKFDVEGAELSALKGCADVIKRCRPRLMVSAYHKNSDLYKLPLYVKSLGVDYRVYLRHHPYIPSWETNFYFTL